MLITSFVRITCIQTVGSSWHFSGRNSAVFGTNKLIKHLERTDREEA
jgi:hypothetical protein